MKTLINNITWYNNKGEEYIKKVNMVVVKEMVNNPDLYADNCVDAIEEELMQLIESKEIVNICEVADTVGEDRYAMIAGVISTSIIETQPELLEVLAQWNKQQTVDEVIDNFVESNKNTLIGIIANLEYTN